MIFGERVKGESRGRGVRVRGKRGGLGAEA